MEPPIAAPHARLVLRRRFQPARLQNHLIAQAFETAWPPRPGAVARTGPAPVPTATAPAPGAAAPPRRACS